jgi:hypothetical protein
MLHPLRAALATMAFVLLTGPAQAQPAPAPAARPAPAPYEVPKPAPAAKFLGSAMTSPNYTVKPTARSDGIMRIFEVDSAYGQFQFDGVEFTKLRLREIDATRTLEKMSQSEQWAKSFGRAAIAPLKFGVDFVVNPFESINRSATGIHNMFDRASASMQNQKAQRDSMPDALLGISDSQRQLAITLNVDPYTDFPPLQKRLQEMARVMSGGQLTVKAGLAAVTGGIGLGISAASNIEGAKETLRDKTAAQVLVEVRTTLASLGVPDETISRLLENQAYTPSFLLIMSRSLADLKAQNTEAFVERAAEANSYGTAYFHGRRAELLAARSAELGGIVAFVSVSGHAVNVTRDGTAVALFPLDDLAWTELPARTFRAANAELRRGGKPRNAMFATTGLVTPMASAEIKKLGWKVVHIKPTR